MIEESESKDIDPSDSDRWCQYIIYKNLEKIAYGRISHGGITDTEIQIGRFLVGTNQDNLEEINETAVPEHLKLPSVFKGKGSNGHQYQVFEGPKYFGRS